mgnify:CR=1 FL=1
MYLITWTSEDEIRRTVARTRSFAKKAFAEALRVDCNATLEADNHGTYRNITASEIGLETVR